MRVVTVARKPVQGTATHNVLRHGCGAINIDGCRIGTGTLKQATAGRRTVKWGVDEGGCSYGKGTGAEFSTEGRWPANVILQHKRQCQQVGTKTMPGYAINRWDDGAKPFGGGAGHKYTSEQQPEETVEVWECIEGCPVAHLEKQNESAPRFFFQVQEDPCNQMISGSLWDHLVDLISPPFKTAPLMLSNASPECLGLDKYKDQEVHGIFTCGDPSEVMDEMDRVLKPGAFVLVLSAEEDPTGADAACALEDFGYEIRDAIAVLDEPIGDYTSKAGKKERNAGVPKFKAEVTFERFFPVEGSDLDDLWEQINEIVDEKYLDNWLLEGIPEEELPDHLLSLFEERVLVDVEGFRNNHPTVKPVAIMEALMGDLPKGSKLIDPFMGSGSTGMAAITTGMDFIGIEQDESYLKIAHHRIHHADRANAAWLAADIESEAEEEDEEAQSLTDFFGI